jgi:hypothetical protein
MTVHPLGPLHGKTDYVILPYSTEDNPPGIRLSHYSRLAKLIPTSLVLTAIVHPAMSWVGSSELVQCPEILGTLKCIRTPAIQLTVRRTQRVQSPIPFIGRQATFILQEAIAKMSTRQVPCQARIQTQLLAGLLLIRHLS